MLCARLAGSYYADSLGALGTADEYPLLLKQWCKQAAWQEVERGERRDGLWDGSESANT